MTDNQTTPPEPSPIKPGRFVYAPLPGRLDLITVFEALLKQPGRVIWELGNGRGYSVAALLVLIAMLSLGVYGVVAGSLTGGSQMLIAPVKIILGSALSLLICLPSLYIFLCLSGSDGNLRQVAGMLISSVSLSALLLLSFAPVAWVFSQSTDSLGLMGFLHLIFWTVAMCFGLSLLRRCIPLAGQSARGNLGVWIVIYLIVSLQMMTALRPIIGRSETFLPAQKQFFLAHWADCLTAGSK